MTALDLPAMGAVDSQAGNLDALVLDAAQRQALVAVRELGRTGLGVGAAECGRGAPAFASRWCASRSLLPDVAGEEEAFLDAVLDLCGTRRPHTLIPSHDGTIEAIRTRRPELDAVVGVALAAEPGLGVAMDKTLTLAAAGELGLEVPRGVVVEDPGELAAALAEVGLPAVVKPARAWARAPAHTHVPARTQAHARAHTSANQDTTPLLPQDTTPPLPPPGTPAETTAETHRGTSAGAPPEAPPGRSAAAPPGAPSTAGASTAGGGVRLNAMVATTAEAAGAALAGVLASGVPAVIQEWLPGAREAVSLLYAGGRVWAGFAQRATRTVPPLGGSSVARESIPLPADLAAAARRLVGELELEGYSEVEFRRDAAGRGRLMEINPRLSASVELAVRAGVPFPRLLHEWAAGERLAAQGAYRTGVRMRWLGGDVAWLRKVLATQGQPDSPGRTRAVARFVAEFARPQGYDYVDFGDPRPALAATGGRLRRRRAADRPGTAGVAPAGEPRGTAAAGMDTEVAVIGAGPYGLSIAAHLAAGGVDHVALGEPMETWCGHMPRGMCLKSEGFASNLSDPAGELTLERFCAEEGLEYGDVGVPVRLETFEGYGRCFQGRFVPGLRRERVRRLAAQDGGFALELAGGETLRARRVVVASGVQGQAYLPRELRGLPRERVIHSFDQRDPAAWRGLRVAVVGAGQSALDAAVLLGEAGAEVTLVARTRRVVWNADPVLGRRSLWARVRYPSSGLGDGLKLWLYARHPLVVQAAPERRRLAVAYTALGPAGAWWLRRRFEGRVGSLLGRAVEAVEPVGEELQLRLRPVDGAGEAELVRVDRVLAGTGYRANLAGMGFLDPALRALVATAGSGAGATRTIAGNGVGETSAAGTPVLDRSFESSVRGLHFVGYVAAGSFGPVMRFVYGADFTARRLARVLG